MNAMCKQTCSVFASAVAFFADICEKHWADLRTATQFDAQLFLERNCHATAGNTPVYPFDAQFPNFPSYLRRDAIASAFGAVKSYHSNLVNWEDSGQKGSQPAFPSFGKNTPSLYYGNMFQFSNDKGEPLPAGELSKHARVKVFCSQRQLIQDKEYTAQVKKRITSGVLDPGKMVWDWMPVTLKTSDIAYLQRRQASGAKILSPKLVRKGRSFELRFAASQSSELSQTPVKDQVIVAVDLGINTPATCSVMRADGTILAREFYHPAGDMGLLSHRTALISRAQSHGSRKTPTLWRMADNANKKLSDGTAEFIINLAMKYHADVIVFEHLDLSGKKRGSKKARLHHWRAKYVQELVSNRAHARGMHIATVCAWGTSRLAYDGSGVVTRNVNNNYSICRFKSGKVYNCDLSASYNIGARYFLREYHKQFNNVDVATPQRTLATLKDYVAKDQSPATA